MGYALRKDALLRSLGCLGLALLPSSGWGQGPGSEFQVNTLTTNEQYLPSITSDAQGNFLVVWNSAFGGSYVYGQRFDSTGTALGGELELNDSTLGIEISRSVAADGGGDFLGVWEGDDTFGGDRYLSGRAFDPNGVPRGAAFPIDSSSPIESYDLRPQIAAFGEGKFVVTWQDYVDYELQVVGRIFDESGNPTSGQFAVSQSPEDTNRYPDVAGSGDEFVVVWEHSKVGGAGVLLHARRFDSGGDPIGEEFQISESSSGEQIQSSVAMDSTGRLVIAWNAYDPDDPGWSLFARRFDATNSPVGGDLHVNTSTTGSPRDPSVAVDASGEFVVVWHAGLQDGSGGGVFGQHFDSAGEKLGGEFQVNTYTTGNQGYPQVVAQGASIFVAVWSSEGQDGSYSGIFGRRLRIRVFSDGFEAGDVCAWSATSGGGCP